MTLVEPRPVIIGLRDTQERQEGVEIARLTNAARERPVNVANDDAYAAQLGRPHGMEDWDPEGPFTRS